MATIEGCAWCGCRVGGEVAAHGLFRRDAATALKVRVIQVPGRCRLRQTVVNRPLDFLTSYYQKLFKGIGLRKQLSWTFAGDVTGFCT